MEEGPTSWWVLSCSIWVGLLVAQKGRLGRGDILHLLWGVCSASVFLHFILRVEPDFKVGALALVRRACSVAHNIGNMGLHNASVHGEHGSIARPEWLLLRSFCKVHHVVPWSKVSRSLACRPSQA